MQEGIDDTLDTAIGSLDTVQEVGAGVVETVVSAPDTVANVVADPTG